jgi:DNA-binding transcriptional ArsR family regulator
MSIASLTAGSKITRQAITKHLRMMEEAGLLRSTRQGRENVWELDQERLREVRRYLKMISRLWGEALDRLKDPSES